MALGVVVERQSKVTADDTPKPHKNLIDLSGKVYSRLTVLGRAPNKVRPNGRHETQWFCICECGEKVTVSAGKLRKGDTKSCGCLVKDLLKKRHKEGFMFKYGTAGNKAYHSWAGAKYRTTDPKNAAYKHYGGRGITMCQRWLDSYEAFLADMGYPPPGTTLDRIDNNAGYHPENCRWATKIEQARNRRTNRLIRIGDEEKTLAEWSEISGVRASVILKRIDESGWPVNRAVFEKPRDTRFKPKAAEAPDQGSHAAGLSAIPVDCT